MPFPSLCRVSIACAGIVCAPALARQGDDVRRFLFDGRAHVDPDLTFSFTRASESTDHQGHPIAAGVPRFAQPTLLCGAPDVQTLPGTAGFGNVNILASGVATDNQTTVLLIQNSSTGTLQILLGAAPAYSYNTTVNPLKGGQSDSLRDSVDVSPDEAWSVRAAAVCHGLIIAMCNVAVRDGNNQFLTNRIGFISCNTADLTKPKPLWWRRVAYSDPLTPCTTAPTMVNTWSMQTWFAPGHEGEIPLRAWFAAADYRSGACKDGGAYCVFPITRSGTTLTDWTVGAPVELPGRFTQTNSPTHAHAIGLTRYGAAGLVALGARGDAVFNNTNYSWTLPDEADYRTGATVPPGALNYYTGPTAWTAPLQINGTIVSPQAPIADRAMGNQWVSVVTGPTPGTFIHGADEVNQALWISSSLTDDPTTIEYTPIYPAGPSNWILPPGYTTTVANRYQSFHIALSEPRWGGGGYAAHLGPGGFGFDHVLNPRIAYSPDGLNWGQCWAHRENAQSNVTLTNGRIYTGSFGQGTLLGVRSTPTPAWRLLKPLRVAPGGMNYIRQDALTPVSLPSCVTVTPAAGPAPCAGPVAHVTVGVPTGQAPALIGTITLADLVPADTGVGRLRLWIRGDTLAQGGTASTVGVQFALRSTDPTLGPSSAVTSAFCPSVFLPGVGEWTPVVLSCDLSAWAAQLEPATLDLVMAPAGGVWVPFSFSIAADSLVIGDMLPSPIAPHQTAGDELASIDRPALTADWTVLLAGAVPPDSWDAAFPASWYPSTALVSLADATGDRSIDVFANLIENRLEAWFWHNGFFDSSHVTINGVSWTTGSPVLLGVSYEAATQKLSVRVSQGGMEIGSGIIQNAGPGPALSRVHFGPTREGMLLPAMDWFGGLTDATRWTDPDIDAALRSLDFLMPTPCPSDFDHNGFVNGDDFDGFMYAFFYGTIDADFDGNTFVNGDDFDAFSAAFQIGC